MKALGTFTSEGYTSIVWEDDDGRVHFEGDMDIDCDGSGGNPHHDPYFQPDTTLHLNGEALNAELVPFIVVPPLIVHGVKGIVMGCLARVTNSRNGKQAWAVVGDVGPTKKLGEGSPRVADLLGINPNPNHGGEDEKVLLYEIWPGKVAAIDGLTYPLQPA